MKKICSFLPAATQMIYDMGLQDHLCGVSFECPPIALRAKAVVVHCVLGGGDYSSSEIDKIFSASKCQGRSLYWVDEDLLQSLAPDIIVTQDVCEVCQIDSRCTVAAVAKLQKRPEIISLTPRNLQDVFQTAITIASSLGKEEAAYSYIARLQSRLDDITDRIRKFRAPLRRVMIMEWIQPIYNCGHWIPFQAAYAGGVDMLSNPAGDSVVTPWEKICRYDPEVLVVSPCGFEVQRSMIEIGLLEQYQEWGELRAVMDQNVWVADFDLFTQPSAGTLVEGVELLAAIFHPEIFEIPVHLQAKCCAFKKTHAPGLIQAIPK